MPRKVTIEVSSSSPAEDVKSEDEDSSARKKKARDQARREFKKTRTMSDVSSAGGTKRKKPASVDIRSPVATPSTPSGRRRKKKGGVTPVQSAKKPVRPKTTRAKSRGMGGKKAGGFFKSGAESEAEFDQDSDIDDGVIKKDFSEELEILSFDATIHEEIPPQVTLMSIEEIENSFTKMEVALSQRKREILASFARNQSVYEEKKTDLGPVLEAPKVILDETGLLTSINNLGTVLGMKEYELRKDQQLCVEKLREILYFEESAKEKRAKADELKRKIAEEQGQIETRTAEVEKEKEKFEPALQAAREQLKGISDRDITELANLRKPPGTVLVVMEAVLKLVQSTGHQGLSAVGSAALAKKGVASKKVDYTKVKYEWNTVRKLLTRKLIQVLVEDFDSNSVPTKVRKHIEAKYLTLESFTVERAFKCSKALGPMVPWILSQLKYIRLCEEMSPITREIASLNDKLRLNLREEKEVALFLEKLEKKLVRSRGEMMEYVRRVVDLQDEIKVVRQDDATLKSQMSITHEDIAKP